MGACTPRTFAPVPKGEMQLIQKPKEPHSARALCLTLPQPKVTLLKDGFLAPCNSSSQRLTGRSSGSGMVENKFRHVGPNADGRFTGLKSLNLLGKEQLLFSFGCKRDH